MKVYFRIHVKPVNFFQDDTMHAIVNSKSVQIRRIRVIRVPLRDRTLITDFTDNHGNSKPEIQWSFDCHSTDIFCNLDTFSLIPEPPNLQTSKPQNLKTSKPQNLKTSKPQNLKTSKPQNLKTKLKTRNPDIQKNNI